MIIYRYNYIYNYLVQCRTMLYHQHEYLHNCYQYTMRSKLSAVELLKLFPSTARLRNLHQLKLGPMAMDQDGSRISPSKKGLA